MILLNVLTSRKIRELTQSIVMNNKNGVIHDFKEIIRLGDWFLYPFFLDLVVLNFSAHAYPCCTYL